MYDFGLSRELDLSILWAIRSYYWLPADAVDGLVGLVLRDSPARRGKGTWPS